MTHITSPHNPRLKAVRRLHSKARARAQRQVRGRGRGPDRRRPAGRTRRSRATAWPARGSVARAFTTSSPPRCAAVSTLGSGTRVIGVYEQRWGAPVGRCACTCTGWATRATSAPCCAPRRRSARRAWRSGPGCADPHSPKAVRASMGAIFAVTLARGERRGRAARGAHRAGRRRAGAAAPARGIAARRPGHAARGRRARGPAGRGGRGVRAGGADTDRLGVAERRDGRDGGAV